MGWVRAALAELGEVAVGVGLLGAEDGTDLEDAVEVPHEGHLLVQLRGLRQERVLAEIRPRGPPGAYTADRTRTAAWLPACRAPPPLGTQRSPFNSPFAPGV